MNRAKIQDYIDQREEQRTLIYHVEKIDDTHFEINGHPYELVKNYRDGFSSESLAERFSSILSKYDYIVGDWGYDQLRLKGFYDEHNPLYEPDQGVDTIEDYLFEYCNFGCAYFIIHNDDVCIPRQHNRRQRTARRRTPIIHERYRKVRQPSVRQRHNQHAERVKNGHHQKFVIHQRKKRSEVKR
ncbi:YutD family protein [Limosilactobacillus sp. STM2_1]|uniref:YutD family protein n=1 Tax=Limosilactobacillus rudii TaxID=2759755 RepID=A0A7W3ULR7_9LACO|nr:YutD family protein [Limosilactobacillus rudii]MBB1079834.1 YutD family protein [Limosilactobacillus rudii]MBB1097912.1 YutD family protein [Limosilactobacillus rudii]MCD7134981.1 YutD family protein [Limosilactobacillus rudii]